MTFKRKQHFKNIALKTADFIKVEDKHSALYANMSVKTLEN